MLVRVELFIEMKETDPNDAMWHALRQVAVVMDNSLLDVKTVRLPDSPEPDITGRVDFD